MSTEKEKREKNIDKILSNNETAQVRGIKTERIKSVRNRENLTQQKFAKEIDVSLDTIKAIELNEDKLSLDVALRIAKRFNVSLDYLFNITDFMNEDEILIDKAFQAVFNPTIIRDEYELENIGKFWIELMVLSVNEYLIKFLFESNKLENAFLNNELTEFDYNFKMEELKDKYYKALKDGGNITVPHILIPFDKVNNDINKILDKYYKLNNPDNEL